TSISYTVPPSRPKSALAPGSAWNVGSASVMPSGCWRTDTGDGMGRDVPDPLPPFPQAGAKTAANAIIRPAPTARRHPTVGNAPRAARSIPPAEEVTAIVQLSGTLPRVTT